MNDLLRLQLLTSFLAGGAAVTLLTLIAERSKQRTAGIILSLPTNLAVSLFFIGWALSPHAVVEAAPIIPIALGVSMLFTAIYVSVATRAWKNKISAMICSLIVALIVWFILALPLAYFHFKSVPFSLIGYIALTVLAHAILTREPERSEEDVRVHYTGLQKLGRALFAGTVIMLIVYLSKTLGPLWGGIFSVFPAANSSALLILHWQRDAKVLKKVCRTMPLGSPIFLVYTLVAALTFPWFGIIIGTVLAYIASFVALWIYLKLLRGKPDEVIVEQE